MVTTWRDFQSGGVWLNQTRYAKWGAPNKWGPAVFAPDAIIRIEWPNQTYIEKFKDTDFDSGTGTGVWDTTSKTLTL